MTRVAAIDCGTNSIRLLVADVDPRAGTLVDLDRRMEVVRLGQGVDRTGRIAPEALGHVEEIYGISAGGMPTRVKCLHVLVGHALAAGPGVNPLGDEALERVRDVWSPDRCTC